MTRKLVAIAHHPRSSTVALAVWAALVFGFLYLPLVVVATFSFVKNPVSSLPLGGFTTQWYHQAYHDGDVIAALKNSVVVALCAVAIAVLFGVPGALLVDRYDFPGRRLFQKFVLLPLILPGVISGVSFLTFYKMLNIPLSLWTVVLGHGTALISTVLTTVYARLLRIDRSVEEASLDLAASRWKTFWFVTLPSVRTAIIASALLAFTLSFDEIPVTFFIIGAQNTLPMEIWSMLRRGFTPEINAVATVIVCVGIVVVTLVSYLSERGSQRSEA
jgi:spermidine/putrescine transport system permease protein